MEARYTIIQAIRKAESVSTSHQPQIFARAQGYGKADRDNYFTYLRKLGEFHENNLTVSRWNTLSHEQPYSNKEELPYYISLMNRQQLFIIS